MVPRNDLKRINMLSDMPDDMLDRLAGIARLYIYSANMPLFDSGENLKHFYMVLTGQVSLSIDLVSNVSSPWVLWVRDTPAGCRPSFRKAGPLPRRFAMSRAS